MKALRPPYRIDSMLVTWVLFGGLFILFLFLLPSLTQKLLAKQNPALQPIIADGQFVWGPNVGDFDTEGFLDQQESALRLYAEEIEDWASYTSLNPMVLLTVLELRTHWVSSESLDDGADVIRKEIEDTAMELALSFYDHMYTYGARSPQNDALPSLSFPEVGDIQISRNVTSASFAIGEVLAENRDYESWVTLVSSQSAAGFSEVFHRYFPTIDLTDPSNNIQPSSLPPNGLFQLPFPLGATWTFNGTHSWYGGDLGPDRSSMDFSTNWPKGTPIPTAFTVAAHEGSGYVRTPSKTSLPCWIEIHHEQAPGEIWTTSYYHLQNLGNPGARGIIERNQSLGTIGTEVCNGGFASGAHVHFTLKYNGGFYDLDGVTLSGWAVHSGSTPYYSGYIERDGKILYPYAQLRNDHNEYFGYESDYALLFNGDTQQGFNQVRIRIDDPTQDTPGPPADVGYHDFVVEWWMKAPPGKNTAPDITCGTNDHWKSGNILFDRGRSVAGTEWGVSLVAGKVAFGVTGSDGSQITLCGISVVDDGEWHHIAIERNRWAGAYPDGKLWLYVDGKLDASEVGPGGDVSYPDDGVPGEVCGPSPTGECINLDPYLVLGAGKTATSRGYVGALDNIRFSWWIRYLQNFNPLPGFQVQDPQTVSLLDFNEGRDSFVYDTGGFNGGTSNGELTTGGIPRGPRWMVSDLSDQNALFAPILRLGAAALP